MSNASKRTAPASTAPASASSADGGSEDPDFSNWSREQIGFAPYWNPKVGAAVFFTLLSVDARDPSFVRYICRAEGSYGVDCFRGRAVDAKPVHVNKGESFTLSVYESLEEAFDFYLASGLSPRIRLTAMEKVPTNTPGRSVWTWEVMVDPTVAPKLAQLKAAYVAKQIGKGESDREQLNT